MGLEFGAWGDDVEGFGFRCWSFLNDTEEGLT